MKALKALMGNISKEGSWKKKYKSVKWKKIEVDHLHEPSLNLQRNPWVHDERLTCA